MYFYLELKRSSVSLEKLIKEVLKNQEEIVEVRRILTAFERKLDSFTNTRVPVTPDSVGKESFLIEPLKEINDVHSLEKELLNDDDKFHDLVTFRYCWFFYMLIYS